VPAVDEQNHDKGEPTFALGLDDLKDLACGSYRSYLVGHAPINCPQPLRDIGLSFLKVGFPSSDSGIVGRASRRVRAAINDGLDHARFIMFIGLNDIWNLSMQFFASLATQTAQKKTTGLAD
jgi:hypothetical protein